MLAVLLSALLPSVTYAFMSSGKSDVAWNVICRSPAYKTDARRDAQVLVVGKSVPSEKAIHAEHCPFCLTHADSFALPPTIDLVMPGVSKQQLLPFLFTSAPSPLFAWTTAQSRAPPA